MWKTISLCTMMSVFCTSCVMMTDQEIRNMYAIRYAQSIEFVEQFYKHIQPLTVEQIAIEGAEIEKSKFEGQKTLRLSDLITITDVYPQKDTVVFVYQLSPKWNTYSAGKQQKFQQNMQNDLTYRTCSLNTVRLAQAKGLKEEHRYYQDDHLIFVLKANGDICRQNGFTN